jgi:23S rRNA G2069 N7-methylase RlmK/C1962 C5-methylase RlmI
MDETDSKTAAQADMLAGRLRKRFRHLRKWARRTGTGAFRLYDRDIPEIPLVLDMYGDAVSGALYRRPYEKSEAEECRWLAAMRDAAASALGIPAGHVFIKYRERKRGMSQYEKFGEAFPAGIPASGFVRDVAEGDLLFRVNLSDYLDTGLFPDRRKMRLFVRRAAAGKSVLNLFSYTCASSVCAARGGAVKVDSVDLSNTYLEWGAANFALNGLSARFAAPRGTGMTREPFSLVRADALSFIETAEREGLSWDLIILDPPAFSNSKKMKRDLDTKRDHAGLIRRCLGLLRTGGKLLFSTGSRRFRIDSGAFRGAVVEDMRSSFSDEDFPEARAPACFLFTAGAGPG